MDSSSPPHQLPAFSDMDLPPLPAYDDSPAQFEWSELLDFTLDDQLLASLDVSADQPHLLHHHQEHLPPVSVADQAPPVTSNRVRKRDPPLACSNFLAGRVPCACPEFDDKMEEVDGGPSGKKRPRTGRSGGVMRCQVPGCEADIRELKGYHRRHRVCLTCANASSVLIGEVAKRYCQQCGKFHLLSDYDEGKRSCRRKLERHNNRRRRKSISRDAHEKEAQGDLLFEYLSSDDEAGRDKICTTSQIAEDDERELSQDHNEGNVSNICSVLDSQNMPGESFTTFAASAETQVDGGNSDDKYDLSPSYCNRSAYSSMCPTGRISFKLYDWNPAEFPRRLRHQIFQWLDSMPIELEGYIRPGCTILTAFISMPQFAWLKLLEDPASCLRDFLAPGGMLWGRGTAFAYVNNMIFRVLRDGTSVVKVEVGVRVPKLHHVYPSCFEAGKPLEFVICGSHLLQPNFRSLVSFSGRYLNHDYDVVFPCGKNKIEASLSFDYQWLRINVSYTEPDCIGPAFIEVENASGLSNFIPILIADRKICTDIEMIQQKCDPPLFEQNTLPEDDIPPCLQQTEFSDLILDIAWLLKEPSVEKIQRAMTSSQIQRINYLLSFLISSQSTSILERILQRLEIVMDEIDFTRVIDGINNADMLLFQKYIALARGRVCQKIAMDKPILPNINCFPASSAAQGLSVASVHVEDLEMEAENAKGSTMLLECLPYWGMQEAFPLLNGEVSIKSDDIREWPLKSCRSMIVKKITNPRSLFYLFAAVTLCLGVCTVLFHPNKSGSFAVTIRRCLSSDSF